VDLRDMRDNGRATQQRHDQTAHRSQEEVCAWRR
jgi:hypothetical protein